MAKALPAERAVDPLHTGDLFIYEELFILQQHPDNPESIVSKVGEVVIGWDSSYYVEDERERRIVVYNEKGEYVRSIGRVGDGPGEFRSIEILTINDDGILVFDTALNRATRIQLNGNLIDVITAPTGSPRLEAIYPIENNDLLLMRRTQEVGPNQTMFTRCIATRISAAKDTAWSITTNPVATAYILERGGQENILGHYFLQGIPSFQLTQAGRILASSGIDQELVWYSLQGELAARITLAFPTMTVSSEEVQAVRTPYEAILRKNPGARATELFLDNLQFPPVKGLWDNVLVDDKGYFWMQVPEMTEQRRQMGGPLVRVVATNGTYLGDTRLPVMHGHIWNGKIAGLVENNETGDQVLTVYRIVPAQEGISNK